MDTKLETLISFSETRSFTRTAQQLGLTQPAVSQHIRSLEKEYGTRLTHRTEGGMQLTPQGEVAVRYAKQIVALYRSLAQRMEEHRRCAGGYYGGLDALGGEPRDGPGAGKLLLRSQGHQLYHPDRTGRQLVRKASCG